MTNIEERVLSMKFDNKQFSVAAENTMDTLDGLKDKLNFKDVNTKSLQPLQDSVNNFDGSGMSRAVESVRSSFGALDVVGMSVINRLTNGALDMGKRMVSAITDPIIQGGRRRAENIEQAEFMIEGLGMDVEAVMDSANESVLGTAYGLDEAAKAAAQFGASGMEAGEDMTSALRGISGVAAMTSSEYDEIARIFTKVSGNGRLMGDELNQLSGRGINAAATLAESMGTTEEAIREMVSAGEIDFETFYTAMDEAFGEHATKANETYSGSLSNMNAALSRVGAKLAGPKLTNMRDIFNSVTPVINSISAGLDPLFDKIVEFQTNAAQGIADFFNSWDTEDGGMVEEIFGNIGQGLANLMTLFQQITTPIKEAFAAIFDFGGAGDGILTLTEIFVKLTEAILLNESVMNAIKYAFMGFFGAIKIVVTGIGWVIAGIGALIAGFVWIGAQVGRIVSALVVAFGDVGEAIGANITDKLDQARTNVEYFFRNIVSAVSSALRQVKSLMSGDGFIGGFLAEDSALISFVTDLRATFGSALDIASSFIRALNGMTATEFAENVRGTVEIFHQNFTDMGINTLSVAQSIAQSLATYWGVPAEAVSEFASNAVDAMNSASDVASNIGESFKFMWEAIKTVGFDLDSLTMALASMMDVIWGMDFMEALDISMVVRNFLKPLEMVGTGLSNFFPAIERLQTSSAKWFGGGIFDGMKLQEQAASLSSVDASLDGYSAKWDALGNVTADVLSTLFDVEVDSVHENLIEPFETWRRGVVTGWRDLGDAWSSGVDAIKNMPSSFSEVVTEVDDGIDGLRGAWKDYERMAQGLGPITEQTLEAIALPGGRAAIDQLSRNIAEPLTDFINNVFGTSLDTGSVQKFIDPLMKVYGTATRLRSLFDELDFSAPFRSMDFYFENRETMANIAEMITPLSGDEAAELVRVSWGRLTSAMNLLDSIDWSQSLASPENIDAVSSLIEQMTPLTPENARKMVQSLHDGFEGVREYDYEGAFENLREFVGNLGTRIAEWISNAVASVNWERVGQVFAQGIVILGGLMISAIGGLATLVWDFLKNFFTNLDLSPLGEIFTGAWPILSQALGRIGDVIEMMIPRMAPAAQAVGNIFVGLLNIIQEVIGWILDTLSGVDIADWFNNIVTAMTNMDMSAIMTAAGIALTGAGGFVIGRAIKNFLGEFQGIGKSVNKMVGGITDAMAPLAGKEKEAKGITVYAEALMTMGKALLLVAAAAIVFAVAMIMFSSIPFDDMKNALIGFAATLGIVVIAMAAMTKMASGMGNLGGKKGLGGILGVLDGLARTAIMVPMILALSVAMVSIGIAVGMLAASLWLISTIDTQSLINGLIGMVTLMIGLALAVRLLPEKNVLMSAFAVIALAGAVSQLQKGLQKMAELSWSEVARGLLALAGSMFVLIYASSAMQKLDIDRVSGAFLKLAISMGLFAISLKMLNDVSWEAMAKGILLLVTVFGGMAVLGKIGDLTSVGTQMLMVAASLLVFAAAFAILGNMEWQTLLQGILTMGGTLLVIGIALRAFPTKQVAVQAGMIVALAASLLILSGSLTALGNADIGAMAKGLGILAAMMLVMGAALFLLDKRQQGVQKTSKKAKKPMQIGPILKLGAAMLVAAVGISAMAGALLMLLPAIAGFAALGFEKVAIGMAGIGLALGVLAIGGLILKPVVMVFVALAGSMALIALAATAFAAALSLAAVAVSMLAVAGAGAISLLPVLATAIAMAFVNIITTIGDNAERLGGAIVQVLVQLIIAIRDVIVQGGPVLLEAFLALLAIIAEAIIQGTPMVADALIALIKGLMKVIIEAGPDIGQGFLALLEIILEVLGEGIPMILEFFVNLFISLLELIAEKVPEIAEAFTDVLIAIIDSIGDNAPRIIDAMIRLMNDIADSIENQGPEMREAFRRILVAIKDQIVEEGALWLSEVGDALSNIIDEIRDWIDTAIEAAADFGRGIKEGIQRGIDAAGAWVSNTMHTLTFGLVGSAKDDLESNSPSKVFMRIGNDVVAGLTNGIDDDAYKSARASGAMAGGVIDEANKTLDINSPSGVFYDMGESVTQGLTDGIEDNAARPIGAVDQMFGEMVRIANDSSMEIGDKLFAILGTAPMGENLKRITRKAREDREEAFDLRGEAITARERELEEEIVASGDRIISAREQAKTAREEADQIAGDAAKSQAERDHANRKADLAHKQIAWEEEKFHKAFADQTEFEAERAGYAAGGAWSEGVIDGMTDSEGKILTEAELITNRLYEEYDEFISETDELMSALDGVVSVRDNMSGMSDSLMEFTRALERFNTSSSSKSARRNLGSMVDSLMAMAGSLVSVIKVVEEFRPYLPQLLGAFDAALPAIIPVVAQFAPALAATLGGGLAAALPAIAGPAAAIIAAVAGIGIFLHDYGSDQKIAKLVKRIFEGLLNFLKNLPRMIVGLITTIVRGFVRLIQDLPKLSVWLIEALSNLIVQMIIQLPTLITELVVAIIDLFVTILSSPALLAETVLRIVGALLEAIVRIAFALGRAVFELGGNLIDALVSGVRSAAQRLIQAFLRPFRTILTFIQDVFSGGILEAIRNIGRDVANETADSFRDDYRPMITPVVDMSQVDESMSRMDNLSSDRSFTSSAAVGNMDAISDYERERAAIDGANTGGDYTHIEYTQNNTSPRPLSAIEIYRNTRKQLELSR